MAGLSDGVIKKGQLWFHLSFKGNFVISFVFNATLVDWPKISRHFLDQSKGRLEIKISGWRCAYFSRASWRLSDWPCDYNIIGFRVSSTLDTLMKTTLIHIALFWFFYDLCFVLSRLSKRWEMSLVSNLAALQSLLFNWTSVGRSSFVSGYVSLLPFLCVFIVFPTNREARELQGRPLWVLPIFLNRPVRNQWN